MKKKKSLWNIFLIPILIIVFVQGAVPFLTLIFSGIRSNMENAVIGLDSHTVENRKVVLENDMIEQWSSVYKESDSLSSALTKVLSNHQMDMQGFMGSGKLRNQERLLATQVLHHGGVATDKKKRVSEWATVQAHTIKDPLDEAIRNITATNSTKDWEAKQAFCR